MEASAPPPDRGGVCYGYRPIGPLSFQQLRAGGGDPLWVEELPCRLVSGLGAAAPILQWVPRPGNPFSARLYRDGRDFVFDVDGMGCFVIHPDRPGIGVPPGDDVYRRESRMWGVPATLCFSQRGDVPLHAAAVGVGDAALLFVGPSQHGKTTLAAAFLARGHRLLAEDIACVRLGLAPAVVPGPPTLRIRQDVWRSFRPPGGEVIAEDEDRVHLLLSSDMRGDGDPVPLHGIVFLHVSEDGQPTLERRTAAERLPSLWITSHNLPSDEGRAQRFEQLASLGSVVPLWDLVRPLNLAGLPALVELLVTNCVRDI